MAATTKMTRILAVTSLPAAGLFLIRVHAEGKKVRPIELEIYDKPILAQEVVMPDPPSDLEVKVSTGRRQVLSYWDSVKGVFGKGQSLVQTANNKTSEFMALVSTDQTFQIKVATISSAVLIGAILAGRGKRRIRRTVYSVGLGTVAASICYPQKAWIISKKVYEKSKVLFKEMKSKYDEQKEKRATDIPDEKPETTWSKEEEFAPDPIQPVSAAEEEILVQSKDEPPTPKDEILTSIKEMEVIPISSALDTQDADRSYLSYIPFLGWFFKAKQSVSNKAVQSTETDIGSAVVESSKQSQHTENKPDVKVAEDHGQSNPEDKDMYSTRS